MFSGTPQSGIAVYTTYGKSLGTTYHYQGASGLLLGQKTASVNTLVFHPRRMLAAAASGGGVAGVTGEKSTCITLVSWDAPVVERQDSFDLLANPTFGYHSFDSDSLLVGH